METNVLKNVLMEPTKIFGPKNVKNVMMNVKPVPTQVEIPLENVDLVITMMTVTTECTVAHIKRNVSIQPPNVLLVITKFGNQESQIV